MVVRRGGLWWTRVTSRCRYAPRRLPHSTWRNGAILARAARWAGRQRHVPQVPPRIVILTTFDLDEYVYAALQAGASGFLLKDVSPEHLVGAVRTVAIGDALLAFFG